MTIRYPLTDLQSRSHGSSPFTGTLCVFGGAESDGGEAGWRRRVGVFLERGPLEV